MFLDLSHNRVELILNRGTARFTVAFPLKVEKLYLQNGHGHRQKLAFSSWWGDSWQYELTRPETVMRGVTHLVAKGINREQMWEARTLGGILSIRVSHNPTTFDGPTLYMWIGLWEGLEEDPNQLQFRFDPEEPSRFDFIG